jgi:hypothetical protein
MRYRSKPQEVEAVQWLGDNADEVGCIAPYKFATESHGAGLRGLLKAGQDGAQGWVKVPIGHYVVRRPGDVTDLWPVAPDYFEDKYEAVTSGMA